MFHAMLLYRGGAGLLPPSRLLHFVPTCPLPAYDTGCTHCPPPKWEAGMEISPKPLRETKARFWKHVVVFTGTGGDAWPARIELQPGSMVAEMDRWKRQLLSPNHPVLVNNTSLDSPLPVAPGRFSVGLYPDNKLFQLSLADVPTFMATHLCPRRQITPVYNPFKQNLIKQDLEEKHLIKQDLKEKHLFEQNLSKLEVSKQDVSKHLIKQDVSKHLINPDGVENDPSNQNIPCSVGELNPMVLVCGHARRDVRCGVMAPLIVAEFEAVLRKKGLLLSPANPRGWRVGTISHVGGHAYAGNVLVFDQEWAGGETGGAVWYGRVQPSNVQGIVEETIVGRRVIEELYRG